MSVLASRFVRNEATSANREALLGMLAQLDEERARVNGGGGAKYLERHRARGKLPARERIELLLDRDSPFLELSPFAAWGTAFPVGAGSVTGIGVVEGVEVLVNANDPTVRGGTTNPYTLRKLGRAHDIARENRLPYVEFRRVGRSRPADPIGDLHPGRPRLSRSDDALGSGNPDHRAGLRQFDRGRRLRPRDE